MIVWMKSKTRNDHQFQFFNWNQKPNRIKQAKAIWSIIHSRKCCNKKCQNIQQAHPIENRFYLSWFDWVAMTMLNWKIFRRAENDRQMISELVLIFRCVVFMISHCSGIARVFLCMDLTTQFTTKEIDIDLLWCDCIDVWIYS